MRAKINFKSYYEVKFGSDRLSPEPLKAIPEFIWNGFIAELPLQNLVNGLNLSEHRYLWPAYTYSASTEDSLVQYWRANAFSKYHFLVSLLDSTQEENGFFSEYQVWKAAIDEGVIAKGGMINVAKQHVGSYVTPKYLEKFSHCPSFFEFSSIGAGFIVPKACSIYDSRDVNTNKLNEFITRLPSSKNEPENFAKMLSDVDVIRKIPTGANAEQLNGRILYHALNNFGLFKDKHLNNYSYCHYYFIAIFNDLIYPEVLRKFFELSNLEYEKYDTQANNDVLKLYYKALNTFKVVLHEHLPIDKLIQLSDRWHLMRAAINAKKPEPIIRLEWHPLFSAQTINQVTFTCIVTGAGLRKEGEEMQNCAGGYDCYCLLGDIHIIRVETSSGERATISLEEKNKKFTIIENLKRGKKTPCDEILEASQVFEEKLNKGEIILNKYRGKIELSAKRLDDITEYYPYPLYDHSSQESIYQAYSKTQLPSIMVAANYQQMVQKLSEKFDLTECIGDALPGLALRMVNLS